MTTRSHDSSAEASAGDARASGRSQPRAEIGRWERAISGVVGGVLLVRGLGRRSLRGAAMALAGGLLLYRAISGRSRLYRALAGHATDRERREAGGPAGTEVTRSVTVGRPADELFELWRDPDQLSRIVGHVAEVRPAGEDRLNWRVRGPLGWSLEWDTAVVVDEPGERLRWEPVDGEDLPIEGSTQFRPAPDDRGTEVTLHLRVDPPGGALGSAVFERLGIVPDAAAGKALQRFKSLAETGEIPTLERNPSARGSGDLV